MADRLLPLLFTFTELLAITVTTFNPPKKPLITVANPKARMSLFTLDRLFNGSNLSTALMLSKLSILAINVIEITAFIKLNSESIPKSGKAKLDRISLGKSINNFFSIG